jgi:hypothetical protein
MSRTPFEDTWLLEFVDEPAPAPEGGAARRRAFARARRPVAVAMRLLAAWLAGRSPAPPRTGGEPPPAPLAAPARRPAGLRDARERAALSSLLDFPDTVRTGLDQERP